ncbi:DUF6190 family protein [Streptomyces coeruleorubidus]|uniref:DUF6190 family protein n=1 Tax=Streptomyces coeruleorubidus TaxID=116188 RepID=UPI00237F8D8A|nr:DUF6190 family protein [Streptomyces coeruleorubidus]WDV51179.1 DUF6190 family protein [Streptomyces coeruleorubidus]
MPADPLGGGTDADGRNADYADAALFLGMNSADEELRVACKAFFAARLAGRLVMSLEQVGRCDDVIWGYGRELQDAYYPFMDNLHTVMDIRRLGYDEADVRHALDDGGTPAGLPVHERLLLGMVGNRKGLLHTASPRLLDHPGLPVRAPAPVTGSEPAFPEPLEALYRQSLVLRISADAL